NGRGRPNRAHILHAAWAGLGGEGPARDGTLTGINLAVCSRRATRPPQWRRRWPMPRVLVIEDERKILRGLQRGLQAEGYDVTPAADGDEGCRLAVAEAFDCI